MALASLSLNLTVNTSGWTAGLKKGADQVDKFYSGVSSRVAKAAAPLSAAATGIGSLAKGALAAAGGMAILEGATSAVGLAYQATVGSVAAGIERIDQLSDQAARIGVTTEALSGLRHAANLTGSDAADLDAALEKLNANLGDAAQKATPTSAALARIGLDAKALASQSPDVAFKAIVKGFENVPNAADKASIAMDVFGKGGMKLLNTLGAGSGEIDRLAEEASRFGIAVSQVDAAKIGAAKDAMDRAGAAVQGLGNSLAISLSPFIEEAAIALTKFGTDAVGSVGGAETAVQGIATAFGFVADAVSAVEWGIQKFIAKLIKGMSIAESFFSFMPGSEMAQFDSDWAKTFEEDIDRAFDTKPSERLQKAFDEIKAKSTEAAKSAAEGAKANLGVGSAVADITSSVSDLTDKLREQAETIGMTATQADIYKLAMKGATEAQLADAKAYAARIEMGEKAKKDQDDLKASAKSYFEDTRTAAEKYQQELNKIAQAQAAGYIDDETARRATEKAKKDAGGSEVKFAGADAVGSEKAYTTIAAALTGRGGSNDLAKSSTTTAANTGKMVTVLGKVLAKLPNGSAEVINI